MLQILAVFFVGAISAGPSAAAEPTAREAYADCVVMARVEPARAELLARQWIDEQAGGAPARHCLALAMLNQDRPAEAASLLAEAATIAEGAGERWTADLYGQAGNAALLAGDPAQAAAYLSRALLAAGEGSDPLRSDLLVDRARAHAELGAVDQARADLFSATRAASGNHAAWLLLAAAERRARNQTGAESAIREAIRLVPEDPATLKEAARIAASDPD